MEQQDQLDIVSLRADFIFEKEGNFAVIAGFLGET